MQAMVLGPEMTMSKITCIEKQDLQKLLPA